MSHKFFPLVGLALLVLSIGMAGSYCLSELDHWLFGLWNPFALLAAYLTLVLAPWPLLFAIVITFVVIVYAIDDAAGDADWWQK